MPVTRSTRQTKICLRYRLGQIDSSDEVEDGTLAKLRKNILVEFLLTTGLRGFPLLLA